MCKTILATSSFAKYLIIAKAKSNVVLVEAVRKSKYEDFNQEKALCESLDAQLLGYIAITK